jgi:riboflavin biosynthesis pyrimidine reductase
MAALADRPYVFCHMETSLDGKIMGRFWDVLDDLTENPFFDVAFGPDRVWDHQGWISGRVTTDDNFTNHVAPDLDEGAAEVPGGDFLLDTDRDLYYVSVDPHGRLGWQEDEVHYRGLDAKVIEVLTAGASNAYKDFLRRRRIPYLVCGEGSVDFAELLHKLARDFGFTCVMLGGGGTVNWSMIQAGLVDEVSVMVDPSADGSRETQTLFMQADGLSTTDPVRFHLKGMERVGTAGEQVWLRYTVDNSRIPTRE